MAGYHEVEMIEEGGCEMVKIVLMGWMDEADLEAKYKTKPDRLAAIKKNTRTYWCDIGEVWLYEDMEYETHKA